MKIQLYFRLLNRTSAKQPAKNKIFLLDLIRLLGQNNIPIENLDEKK